MEVVHGTTYSDLPQIQQRLRHAMAFQNSPPFLQFLQQASASPSLGESAPAENFILDERLPSDREQDFLDFGGFAPRPDMPVTDWFAHQKNHAKEHVCIPWVSQTFQPINSTSWLPELKPDWAVVRIETLDGLCDRGRASGTSDAEVQRLVTALITAKDSSTTFDPDDEVVLSDWLDKVNHSSDRRPAFVAPFVEVEKFLDRPDWANRLRDAFGLGHVQPRSGRPRTIVLMLYNLERVFQAHRRSPAWAASPTVLDDVPTTGPNICFFPAPRKSSPDGFGFTIDLAPEGGFGSEFLHAHLTYRLDDIRRIGEVTTEVTDDHIAATRARHRDLLANDLIHLKDLPHRP